jgi:hypothetical protein
LLPEVTWDGPNLAGGGIFFPQRNAEMPSVLTPCENMLSISMAARLVILIKHISVLNPVRVKSALPDTNESLLLASLTW